MRVSHETIYQSLFVQARGALRLELTRCLRTRRRATPGSAVGRRCPRYPATPWTGPDKAAPRSRATSRPLAVPARSLLPQLAITVAVPAAPPAALHLQSSPTAAPPTSMSIRPPPPLPYASLPREPAAANSA
jgi:hypothetical protein